MSNAPIFEIGLDTFWRDPYPILKKLRTEVPVAFVPQLGATLITSRQDIFENEKKIDVFSSVQPDGLMTKLMGQNLMRKDGEPHMAERKAIFPTVSPTTVKNVWKKAFVQSTTEIINELQSLGKADLVNDIAMRISGEALKTITGLSNLTWQEMNRVSQGMIDGCSNYKGDSEIEAQCRNCTDTIDQRIDEMIPVLRENPNHSLLSVHLQAELSEEQYRANVKLAISGGQNEIRDVIAGMIWALLQHPDQLALVQEGKATYLQVLNEYSRWISPVGMSPRRVAQHVEIRGVTLEPDDRVFFMFGAANRDESVFEKPDVFDITQSASASIAFGAGPHFCAGAWAARCLIADVALPLLFSRLEGLRLNGETEFGGWAFRGPLAMPVVWQAE